MVIVGHRKIPAWNKMNFARVNSSIRDSVNSCFKMLKGLVKKVLKWYHYRLLKGDYEKMLM